MAWNTTDFKNDGKWRIVAAPITAAVPDIDYRTSINVIARHRLPTTAQNCRSPMSFPVPVCRGSALSEHHQETNEWTWSNLFREAQMTKSGWALWLSAGYELVATLPMLPRSSALMSVSCLSADIAISNWLRLQ